MSTAITKQFFIILKYKSSTEQNEICFRIEHRTWNIITVYDQLFEIFLVTICLFVTS